MDGFIVNRQFALLLKDMYIILDKLAFRYNTHALKFMAYVYCFLREAFSKESISFLLLLLDSDTLAL
ncbi:MAG: hypothetical protein JWP44_3055 [Mucilaginibacter sp.]|nr:hypothetical protein [Mucilaginibacter sp.]